MFKVIFKKAFFFQNSIVLDDTFRPRSAFFDFNTAYTQRKKLTFVSLTSGFSFILLIPPFVSIYKIKHLFFLFIGKERWELNYNSVKMFTISLFKKFCILAHFGASRNLQFIGFRFRQRWFRGAQVIRYKIGYNKKAWARAPFDFVSIIRRISPKKRNQVYFSHFNPDLQLLVRQLYIARSRSLYKGRGVNLKEQPMVLKEGKKAIW